MPQTPPARACWLLLPVLLLACARTPEAAAPAAPAPAVAEATPPQATPARQAVPGQATDEPGIAHPEYDGTAPQTLVEAGAVADAAQEAAVRQLLGEDDYRLLVDTARLRTTGDAPGLQLFAVRGLFTVMEAALQRHDGQLQVALLDQGRQVRWYSTDAATQAQPPAWFDAWRERFKDTPVRLMSAPGTPLMQAAAHGG